MEMCVYQRAEDSHHHWESEVTPPERDAATAAAAAAAAVLFLSLSLSFSVSLQVSHRLRLA